VNSAPTSKITISASKITGNEAKDAALGVGVGNTVITGCTVSNNYGQYSAGLRAYQFNSLTITGSKFTGNISLSPKNEGGGVELFGGTGTVNIINSSIMNNLAGGGSGGGGVHATGDFNLNITNSIISGNTATGKGGGISVSHYGTGNDVTLKITGGQISDNFAIGFVSYGGGLYVDGTGDVTITGTKITGNTASGTNADFGGGMDLLTSGKVTLSSLTVTDNTAVSGGSGGGLVVKNTQMLSITKGLFSGNSAGVGGGIYADATGTIIGTTISGNAATQIGGGLFYGGTIDFHLAHILGNAAPLDPNVG
jgi:fibronectin-binding autotransporter adhesin